MKKNNGDQSKSDYPWKNPCSYQYLHGTSKILSTLSARERHGVRKPSGVLGSPSRIGFRPNGIVVDDLASAIAWNSRRLQNMILAVGPGTPASKALKEDSNSSSPPSHPSLSNFDDGRGDNSDDDGDNLATLDAQRDIEREGISTSARVARGDIRQQWVSESGSRHCGSISNDNERDDEIEEDRGLEVRNECKGQGHYQSEIDDDNGDVKSDSGEFFSGSLRRSSSFSGSIDQYIGETAFFEEEHKHSDDSDWNDTSECSSQSGLQSHRMNAEYRKKMALAPSIRHGGCINTASWLNCPWRLSLAHTAEDNGKSNSFVYSSSHSSNTATYEQHGHDRFNPHAISSLECPTQLLTSGDDRLVKFWDVSFSMGTASPIPGPTSICPFSSSTNPSSDTTSSVIKHWNKTSGYEKNLPGMVSPLATLRTGHRGNVFHATPVPSRPGLVATCAADGHLHLCDIELQCINSATASAPTIVVSLEHDIINNSYFPGLSALRTGMCFSHHFLDANTGLLCSEKGLRRFDLRLPSQSQPSHSLLGDNSGPNGTPSSCKSCAIWSASECSMSESDSGIDSAYIFAGGSSGEVCLYDLRFVSDSNPKIIQRYLPNILNKKLVSVSGIDISRDNKELLISYENDQIYTFPVFPHVASSAGPTIEELTSYSSMYDNNTSEEETLSELACYGGHLNRYTFLKSAKYAGPNDEYICTGSDSGHAWIYEKATGAVVSLLSADRSTCNGIVPHPSLPFFITYGIDSTAKLWRATTPVDDEVDDSETGRASAYHDKPYKKNPLVRYWKVIQSKLSTIGTFGDESLILLPDEIPSSEYNISHGPFDSLGNVFFQSERLGGHFMGNGGIGNDLGNLPIVLHKNYFSCVLAAKNSEDLPVCSGLKSLKRRVSLIRLRHQADQLGLSWNPSLPWIMHTKTHGNFATKKCESQCMKELRMKNSSFTTYGHPEDLVPQHPSDWIPYDSQLVQNPSPCGMNFNKEQYADFYLENYRTRLSLLEETKTSSKMEFLIVKKNVNDDDESNLHDSDNKRDFEILHETVLVLKNAGNRALQCGKVHLAAHYYDRGIQYCSVAFMKFPHGKSSFLMSNQVLKMEEGGQEQRWSPLLKTLITVRLNLSMTMLKAEIADSSGACDQARLALSELKPFTMTKNQVMTGPMLDGRREGEPAERLRECKDLQAKAYFRLGSAQHAMSDFSSAVRSFENSLKSTREASSQAKPENIVLRRLGDAKRELAKRNKRHRKKFKFMFSGQDRRGKHTLSNKEDKDEKDYKDEKK